MIMKYVCVSLSEIRFEETTLKTNIKQNMQKHNVSVYKKNSIQF